MVAHVQYLASIIVRLLDYLATKSSGMLSIGLLLTTNSKMHLDENFLSRTKLKRYVCMCIRAWLHATNWCFLMLFHIVAKINF